MVKGYAANEPGGKLKPFEYTLGELGYDEIDITVEHCGLCHSDLSMLDNDWNASTYPFVPGHEIVGTVKTLGREVKHLKIGQRVGVGWNAASCKTCCQCLSGEHSLCSETNGTIVGRYGGFADEVRTQAHWAIPIPSALDPQTVGPLFCGGITVYNPMVAFDIKPSARVAVIGIGGLGHMAIMFLKAWGCEVTAFSRSADKETEAKRLGAHHFVNTAADDALENLAGSFDYIISTVNVPLDWNAYIKALAPKGRLHFVGVVLEPINFNLISLLAGQKQISSNPTGSPAVMMQMLDFAARHQIAPQIEKYKFDQVNDAIDKLRNGSPRYRIVLSH